MDDVFISGVLEFLEFVFDLVGDVLGYVGDVLVGLVLEFGVEHFRNDFFGLGTFELVLVLGFELVLVRRGLFLHQLF